MSDRAELLKQIVDALLEHRRAKAASEPDKPLGTISPASWGDSPLPPPWRSRIEHAAEDGVQESLHASIREEGWRAFTEGGLDAMRELADRACGENDYLLGIVGHRWDGIGTDAGGYWVA